MFLIFFFHIPFFEMREGGFGEVVNVKHDEDGKKLRKILKMKSRPKRFKFTVVEIGSVLALYEILI